MSVKLAPLKILSSVEAKRAIAGRQKQTAFSFGVLVMSMLPSIPSRVHLVTRIPWVGVSGFFFQEKVMKKYPSRPTATREIIMQAAAKVADAICDSSAAQDIADAYERRGPDGFSIARELHINGWDI